MTSGSRNRFLFLVVAVCAGILLGFAAVSYVIYDNRRDARAAAAELQRESDQERKVICEAGNRSNQAIVDILNLARSLNGQEPISLTQCLPRPPEGEDFYCRALELLKPIPCGT